MCLFAGFFYKWFNLCVKSTRNPREHEIGLRACQGRVTNGDVSRSLPKFIHFRVRGGSLALAVQQHNVNQRGSGVRCLIS